jgi:predicted Fe-Mo cluster-binding NifX family protein
MSEDIQMKIAVVTDDGATISQHFGRAPYYVVLTVEDGQITAREQRDKFAHHHGSAEQHHEEQHHQGHSGAEADAQHSRMLSPIGDCQVLLARGMGYGAYASLQQAGVKPLVTDVANIDEAVQSYLQGQLVDHTERLH